jgi:hypothetical protein
MIFVVLLEFEMLTDGFAGSGHHQGCERRIEREHGRRLRLRQCYIAIAAWTEAQSGYDAAAHSGQCQYRDDDYLRDSLRIACLGKSFAGGMFVPNSPALAVYLDGH